MNIRKIAMATAIVSFLAAPMTQIAQAAQAQHTPLVTENPQPRDFRFWWPDRLDLSPLRANSVESNPYGPSFDYAKEFNSLDLQAVKKDIGKVLTTSQPWWPADYGNYGPFFIRMAWHSAGTYRIFDGRGGAAGGQQRFEPLNSWPDNVNLDKARRLLWPIKQKYGRKISWGDLMVLTGTVALEDMGFKTYGYAGGRADDWEPDMVYWGDGDKWLSDNTDASGKIKKPLGASQMGLIYVNPEGPNGNHDPVSAASAIRNAFGNMAMDDEETVALIAGGHSFGKAHGAHNPAACVGPAPAGEGVAAQGLGWKNKCGTGNGDDTVTSGLEGAWTSSPTFFTMQYISNLLDIEWVRTQSPAGATQWTPKDASKFQNVPDAHDAAKMHAPMMFTTDIALTRDPSYLAILKRFQKNPDEFKLAFAKAWFKLTHRDMGPSWRYLGSEVPKEKLIWQDPLPDVNYRQIDSEDIAVLKKDILNSGLSVPELVRTAWASAASFRGTDLRGGANGARLRLEPEKHWAVNDPKALNRTLAVLEEVRKNFNATLGSGKYVSMADTIVLAGDAAIEKAAHNGGYKSVEVPFIPGRVDATQAQTDVKSFAVLEPTADGFRNYYKPGTMRPPTSALVDRASMLDLTVPQMTVLIGGLRALDANVDGSKNGVFTEHPGTLSNDFFVNLLDMSTEWKQSRIAGIYEGHERASGKLKWTATPVDLIFGSSSELRAVAEVYASDDAKEKFVHDFVHAWTKVMNLDQPESAQVNQ
jgi:catalase-peroxidase